MTTTQDRQFWEIARELIVIEKKMGAKRVAQRLGLSTTALYNRLEGTTNFTVEEARQLIGLMSHEALADYMLQKSKFFPAKNLNREPDLGKGIHRGADDTLVEASDVIRSYHKALSDGAIDERDKSELLEEIRDVERALAGLKDAVERYRA